MNERAWSFLGVALEGGVLTLTLTNPARKNAIGPGMVNELLHAFAEASTHEGVRVIVLTGAGDTFCAGGDFTQMVAGNGAGALPIMGDYADLLLALSRSPKPVIARVNGHALGGGIGLVAASHFAVAVRGAKLGTPEVDVGIFPMMIMAVLQRVVPRRRLLEMMVLGEKLTADEAAAVGLVNEAVVTADLDAAVKRYADKVMAKSPIALRLGLEAFAAQSDLDLATALPLLRERLAGLIATNDAREGLTAFLEKRKPVWTGR